MSKSEYTKEGLLFVKEAPAATVVTEYQLRISKGKRELKENTDTMFVFD